MQRAVSQTYLRTGFTMTFTRVVQGTLCAVFCLMLLAPHIAELSGAGGNTAKVEKREAETMPEVQLLFNSFPRFARQFDRFYSDSFGLRDKLIRWNSALLPLALDESPINTVRIGRDGWLFLGDEEVLEEYENVMSFSPEQLKAVTACLEERRAWLDRKGIKFFVIVPPLKHNVYPEYLPSYIRKIGNESRIDQLKKALKAYPKIEFIDVREALLAAKPAQRLYYKTDTHWNDYGAFIAYSELMDRIGHYFPGIKRVGIEDFTVKIEEKPGGDLAGMLNRTDAYREGWIILTPKFKPGGQSGKRPYPNPVNDKRQPMYVRENNNKSLPKALIFRDSFATALTPFFDESFQSAVYVWTHDFLPAIVEAEKPDLVILECVEGFMSEIGTPNPVRVKRELATMQQAGMKTTLSR